MRGDNFMTACVSREAKDQYQHRRHNGAEEKPFVECLIQFVRQRAFLLPQSVSVVVYAFLQRLHSQLNLMANRLFKVVRSEMKTPSPVSWLLALIRIKRPGEVPGSSVRSLSLLLASPNCTAPPDHIMPRRQASRLPCMIPIVRGRMGGESRIALAWENLKMSSSVWPQSS